MLAASTSTCLGPFSPLSPVVLGTELSQGCLSLAHFFQRGFSLYTARHFLSGFTQATVTFSFIFVPPLPPSPAFLTEESLPWLPSEPTVTGEDACLPLPTLLFSPLASQTLMQLVVNSSRSCFTVYFSGFKKNFQKPLKKKV